MSSRSAFMKEMDQLEQEAAAETKPITAYVQGILDKVADGCWISDLPALDWKLLDATAKCNAKVRLERTLAHQACARINTLP